MRTVKSADRTLEILELFQREQRPLSSKDISTILGYPASSTMYLLKALTSSGYLNYNKNYRNYFPTDRIRAIGSWIGGHLPDNSEVFDVMRELRARFGETVAIGIRSDLELQYLHAFESAYLVRYHIEIGNHRPLLEAAMGWVILAGLEPKVIENVCLRFNQQRAGHIFEPAVVIAELEKIRRDGYCHMEDRSEPYFAATIAFQLPLSYNDQTVVLGLGGEKARIAARKDEIVEQMRHTIARMTSRD